MKTLPPPPVPQKLREMLKDYPQYLDKLQKFLDEVVAKPLHGTPLFEQAIWCLEGALDSFVVEARKELEIARLSGDPVLIEGAKKKDFIIGYARLNMGGIPDLHSYFEQNGGYRE